MGMYNDIALEISEYIRSDRANLKDLLDMYSNLVGADYIHARWEEFNGPEVEPCRYCGGNCASDEDNACDGYSGDVDGLYASDEHDGQPDEYTEWQDYYGGDDWDHGQYGEDF